MKKSDHSLPKMCFGKYFNQGFVCYIILFIQFWGKQQQPVSKRWWIRPFVLIWRIRILWFKGNWRSQRESRHPLVRTVVPNCKELFTDSKLQWPHSIQCFWQCIGKCPISSQWGEFQEKCNILGESSGLWGWHNIYRNKGKFPNTCFNLAHWWSCWEKNIKDKY